jgi:hypothetical protein
MAFKHHKLMDMNLGILMSALVTCLIYIHTCPNFGTLINIFIILLMSYDQFIKTQLYNCGHTSQQGKDRVI